MTVGRLLCGVVLGCAVLSGSLKADAVSTKARTVTKLAEGVYEIRHPDAPDEFPQGNTTVIIGSDETLVVDSCYLPSSAREDIAQIRQWSKVPVRYLVNTHWHFDHTMGNGAYAEAFPGLKIVAQTETAKQIAGYNPGWFERYPKRTEEFKQRLHAGKDADGKQLTEDELKQLRDTVPGREPVWAEFSKIVDKYPDVTFERELRLDLGGREVRVMHLGRGNTAGDAVVYLPKEKILITGDLVDHPVPYHFGGYPREQIETLRRLMAIDAQMIVPGHGDVLRDKAYIGRMIEFIDAVTSRVSQEVHRLGAGQRNLEAVKTAVMEKLDVEKFRKQFAGDAKEDRDFFDGTLTGLITAAHAEVWGR